jgi:MFS family permease
VAVQNERRAARGVAVAATVGNMVGITPAISATFGVFLVPIATDFDWSRARVSGVLGLISVVSALIYPLVGVLMDRFAPRRLLIAGNLLFGISIALVSQANGDVLQFYLLFALVGVAGSIPSTAMFCKVVSDWFDQRRGLMLGVTAGVGNGVGATFMPILAGVLLGAVGWRNSFAVIGAVVIGLGFPVLYLLLRDAPHVGRKTAEVSAELTGLTLGEAARTTVFWLLLAAVAAGAGGMTAVFTHVVPMLQDHGVGLGEATAVVAIFALVAAAWQVATGFMLDRLRTPRVIIPMYASAIVGMLVLQFGHGSLSNVMAGVLLGIGLGAEFAALPYFISRYFGLKHNGTISGAVYAVVILMQGITPPLMDVSFDNRQTYDVAVLLVVAALALGMLLFAFLPRPDRFEPLVEPVQSTASVA